MIPIPFARQLWLLLSINLVPCGRQTSSYGVFPANDGLPMEGVGVGVTDASRRSGNVSVHPLSQSMRECIDELLCALCSMPILTNCNKTFASPGLATGRVALDDVILGLFTLSTYGALGRLVVVRVQLAQTGEDAVH